MATTVESQQAKSPFFKLPGEIRNIIYSYCLQIGKNDGWKTREQISHVFYPGLYLAEGAPVLNYSFDTTILGVCHRMQQEASAMFKEALKLSIIVGQPKKVWICGNDWVRRGVTPREMPTPLHQILPYASVLPLRVLHIVIYVRRGEPTTGDGLWEPAYRVRIHQLIEAIQSFTGLETLSVCFERLCIPRFPGNLYPYGIRTTPVLECLGRLRGLQSVTISGDVTKAQARALQKLMQRPKPQDGKDDLVAQLACDCKR